MSDQEQKILDRLSDVQQETQKYPPYEFVIRTRMEEIDHLYNLHFNPYIPQSLAGKIAKTVLQKLTGPLLRKQVAYNEAVRDVLKQTVVAVEDLQYEVKRLSEQMKVSQVPDNQDD